MTGRIFWLREGLGKDYELIEVYILISIDFLSKRFNKLFLTFELIYISSYTESSL